MKTRQVKRFARKALCEVVCSAWLVVLLSEPADGVSFVSWLAVWLTTGAVAVLCAAWLNRQIGIEERARRIAARKLTAAGEGRAI